MADTLINDTAAALQQELGLQLPATITEDGLLQLLADKIAAIVTQSPEKFYQLMYRLDIPERQLNSIIGDHVVNYEIARLVYNRQLQKIQSRRHNSAALKDEDPELSW